LICHFPTPVDWVPANSFAAACHGAGVGYAHSGKRHATRLLAHAVARTARLAFACFSRPRLNEKKTFTVAAHRGGGARSVHTDSAMGIGKQIQQIAASCMPNANGETCCGHVIWAGLPVIYERKTACITAQRKPRFARCKTSLKWFQPPAWLMTIVVFPSRRRRRRSARGRQCALSLSDKLRSAGATCVQHRRGKPRNAGLGPQTPRSHNKVKLPCSLPSLHQCVPTPRRDLFAECTDSFFRRGYLLSLALVTIRIK